MGLEDDEKNKVLDFFFVREDLYLDLDAVISREMRSMGTLLPEWED